ncbi:MAG TPA: anti-sigma factor [Thermoanaerobaculia bacterium]|nr:anti-sigma factor [Thermoanaerobaculia bacterium]
MLTCREVSRAVAADELERAGFWKRLGVSFHLLMCRHCRRYSDQLGAIGRTARELFREVPPDPAAVDRLREAILRRGKPRGED